LSEPRCLASSCMVARYEGRPVRNDDCADDQAGPTRFCGGTSAKLIARATFLAGSHSTMSATLVPACCAAVRRLRSGAWMLCVTGLSGPHRASMAAHRAVPG
jgi:hypothetical protein